jgi:hypothetical protein
LEQVSPEFTVKLLPSQEIWGSMGKWRWENLGLKMFQEFKVNIENIQNKKHLDIQPAG